MPHTDRKCWHGVCIVFRLNRNIRFFDSIGTLFAHRSNRCANVDFYFYFFYRNRHTICSRIPESAIVTMGTTGITGTMDTIGTVGITGTTGITGTMGTMGTIGKLGKIGPPAACSSCMGGGPAFPEHLNDLEFSNERPRLNNLLQSSRILGSAYSQHMCGSSVVTSLCVSYLPELFRHRPPAPAYPEHLNCT